MARPLRHGRPWRRLPSDLFTFTTTESADLHVAVMCVLDEAAVERPGLSFDDVRQGIIGCGWDAPLTDEQLDRTLAALVRWGHVDATQDHTAHYASPEEFERRNLQYAITTAGQAAVSGMTAALDALSRAASLQPAVLDAIAEGLADLHEMARQPAPDTNRIYTGLMAVEAHHQSLVDNVRQFNTELQRLVGDDATTDGVFLDVKQRTVGYLQEYVTGVDAPIRRVAHAIDQLAELGPSRLFDLALVGANLAPLGESDPGPPWSAERQHRWEALRAWFRPAQSGEQPRIRAITTIAEQAIIQLLRVLERRWESRRRSASVDRDFRRLADWFAAAPDEATAHVLFQAAFGLWPSRHAHLLPDDHEAIPSTAPWTEAPPVVVAPTLRTSGTVAQRGRSRPIADPGGVRARRQREQAEALARRDEVRAALATDGRVPLSALGRLDAEAHHELLDLLGQALNAPSAGDGSRRSISADGQVEIVLAPPAVAGATARLVTVDGVLECPDLTIDIVVCGRSHPAATLAEVAGG